MVSSNSYCRIFIFDSDQSQSYSVPARHIVKKAQRERGREVAIIALLADSGMGGGDRFQRLQRSLARVYCS
jgi:hypothetical protein